MVPTTRSSRTPQRAAVAAAAEQPNKGLTSFENEDVPSTTVRGKKQKNYRKTSPKPQLEQLTFPARKKTMHPKKATKNGDSAAKKQQRHSLPASLGVGRGKKNKDPAQSTLTQIGWRVPSTFPEDDDDDDDDGDGMGPLVVDLTGEMTSAEDEDGKWSTRRKKTGKTKKSEKQRETATNRGRKRRKTTGSLELDAHEDDEEEEDEGAAAASSRYHTQTLTQMPSWQPSEQDDDDDGRLAAMVVGDSDEEGPGDDGGFGLEDDARQGHDATPQSKKRKRPSLSTQRESPHTPSKQRSGRTEIPSSQPSPFTPNLDISQRHWSPLALGVDRTPLKERSTNVDAPMPTVSGRVLKRTRSEIPDSWSTIHGGLGSSPICSLAGGSSQARRVKRTPLKEIRFVDVEGAAMGDVSMELGKNRNDLEGRDGERVSQKMQRADDEVIMDSDEEFQGFLDDESEAPGTPSPSRRAHNHVTDADGSGEAGPVESPDLDMAAQLPSSRPGPQSSVAGDRLAGAVETDRVEIVVSSTPSTRDVVAEKTTPESLKQETPHHEPPVTVEEVDAAEAILPVPSALKAVTQHLSSQLVTHRNTISEPPPEEDDTEPDTPSHAHRRPSSSSAIEKETPLSSPQKTSPAMPPVSQIGYSYKSQAFESQRVPFEIIRQMAPQTDRSDVIMSIHPEHVQQITDGTKTHEFRNYRLPQTVGRMWIYITHPVQQLKYMAIISGYKLPGEIPAEDLGFGNTAFNEGKGSKYAYELKQVYQLNNPVSLERMKENGWVEQAPQKYEYVPPAVLGELMGNLRCALFEEHELGEGSRSQSQGGVTISQELADQLRSDIEHTQLRAQPSSPLQGLRRDGREGTDDNDETELVVASSQDAEIDNEHITATPLRTTTSSARQVAVAKPSAPPSRSQGSVIQIDDSPPAVRHIQSQSQSQHIIMSTVRPSQATTASASSQSQQLLSQQTRTPAKRAQRDGLASLPEDVLVVDDSPVQMRTGKNEDRHTQSSLGLGVLLGSSQGYGLAGIGDEQDSLMDDSRIRMPPAEGEVVWDSEGE